MIAPGIFSYKFMWLKLASGPQVEKVGFLFQLSSPLILLLARQQQGCRAEWNSSLWHFYWPIPKLHNCTSGFCIVQQFV